MSEPGSHDSRTIEGDSEQLNLLLESLDGASGAARTAWLFFIGLMAYLLVAIASVDHKDLLLNSAVQLPFLTIPVNLEKFFVFAPVVLLLVHFGLYMQHVLLARKSLQVHSVFREREERAGLPRRSDPMRSLVHSYFLTQIYAGAERGTVFVGFLRSMGYVSFVLLPVCIFLAFQIAFLPYHDPLITALHRTYVLLDLAIIATMQFYLGSSIIHVWSVWLLIRSLGVWLFGRASALAAIFFAVCVATYPGEWIDGWMQHVLPVQVPVDPANFRRDVVCMFSRSACESPFESEEDKDAKRWAFFLTAYLFDGKVHLRSGAPRSPFSRNIVVTDKELSIGKTSVMQKRDSSGELGKEITTERVKVALRGRNLRFAVFERSNLSGVDFTGAELDGASLRGADLREAKLSCATRPLRNVFGGRFADCTQLKDANLNGADLREADLSGACLRRATLRSADLRGASLYKVNLQRADLSFARLDVVDLTEAKLQGAQMREVELRGALLRKAKLQPLIDSDPNAGCDEDTDEGDQLPAADVRVVETLLERGKFDLADFSLANLRGADMSVASLRGADLTLAQMHGVRLSQADLRGANLSFAYLQGADLSDAKLDGARLVQARLQGAVLRNARMRLVDLSRAQLPGADARLAQLQGATLTGANLDAADLRCAGLPDNWRSLQISRDHVDLADISLGRLAEGERNRIEKQAGGLRSAREKLEKDRQAAEERSISLGERKFEFAEDDTTTAPIKTSCSPKAPLTGEALTAQLVDIACSDPPTVRYVMRGLAKRIVDSLAKDLPLYQAQPASLLTLMRNRELKWEGLEQGVGKMCIDEVEPEIVWRLTLAATHYEAERAANPGR